MDSARIKALSEGVTSLGLRPEHVPTIIPSRVGSFLPPEATWPEATELAVALVMLSTQLSTGELAHISDAFRRLLLPHYRPSQALRELEHGIISNALADRIRKAAVSTLQLGGVDYQYRRALLTGLQELPILSTKPPASAEARSWIWVYLTHGSIVWTGPAWAQLPALLPTREVMRFHHDIGLAARVTLATYADQLLEWLSADDMAAWDSRRDTVVARRIHAGT